MLKGRFGLATLACVGLAIAIPMTSATAWKRGSVQNFAVLPSGAPMVEGLTVGKDGNVYSPTFDLAGPQNEHSLLFAFDPQGHLLNHFPVTITGSSRAMLGLAFYPGTDALLVIDFVNAQVLSVHPETGQASPCITLPPGISFPQAGLNALTFDAAGNIYISDSFGGIIWRRTVTTGSSFCGQVDQQPWAGPDPLLLPSMKSASGSPMIVPLNVFSPFTKRCITSSSSFSPNWPCPIPIRAPGFRAGTRL